MAIASAGNVFRDGGTRRRECAGFNRHRGDNEGGVGANENIVADDGTILDFRAVEIAGDGSRADVGKRANRGVAEVRKVRRRKPFRRGRSG